MNGPSTPVAAKDWARHGARWMSPRCHRSLYSYQLRTALALAVEQPHLAVTFLPPLLAILGRSLDRPRWLAKRLAWYHAPRAWERWARWLRECQSQIQAEGRCCCRR